MIKARIYEYRPYDAVAGLYRRSRGLPPFRRRSEENSFSSALYGRAAGTRLQKEGCSESAQARPETKGQTLGLGPRFPRSGLDNRLRFCFVNLASEFCVGQPLSANRTNHGGKPFRVGHLAIIEAARLFVDITEQMERLYADIGAVERSLQETPEVLHPVGVDIAIRVLDSVIDDGVLIVRLKPFVGFQFVAEDGRTRFDLFVDVLLKFFLFAAIYYEGPNITTALNHSHDDGLVLSASTSDALSTLRLVHVTRFSTDKSLINLYFPAQLAAALFTLLGKPDAMEQKPCGLLGDTERTRYFTTANAILRVLKHPHSRKPFIQTDRGVFHDGSNLDGKLTARMSDAALPAQLVSKETYLGTAATWAYNAVFPLRTTRHEIGQAIGWIGKVADGFQQGLWFVKGFHISSLPQNRVLVKYIFTLKRRVGKLGDSPVSDSIQWGWKIFSQRVTGGAVDARGRGRGHWR